jgi:hypothetical protein
MEFEKDLKLGPLGETKFSEWCAGAQLTANRSLEEDRTGWDHYVEFPYAKTNLPRDKQLSPIECKVQVKATQRKDRKLAIKVSVLKRLVDYSYPAFILFLEFSKDDEPVVENAFLVHVDERVIKRVLKKIRENDTLKKPKNLYEIKLSISYNSKHQLSDNAGLAFRDKALDYISGQGMTKYQETKRYLVDSVGYEKSGFKFQFNAIAKDLDRYITERAIGISESLDIKNTVLFDNRFNLKSGGVETKRSDEAKISITLATTGTCHLRFKASEYAPSINFVADVVPTPQVFKGRNKLILRATLFSFELEFVDCLTQIDAKLHLTLEKQAELDEIIKLFKLLQPANRGEKIICEMDFQNNERATSTHCIINNDLPDMMPVVDAISVLKGSYEIDGKSMLLVDDLYSQEGKFIALANLIQNKTDGMQINYKEETDNIPDDIIAPFSLVVLIGSTAIGAITLLHAKLESDKVFDVQDVEVIEALVFNDGFPKYEVIRELEEKAFSKLEANE